MPEPLTPIEQKVYHYLLDFLSSNTYQPSVREIGREFQIKSTKTVSELLQSLADKGYIERDPSRSRGVRLLGHELQRNTQPVPYYGKVAAGEPALLPENRKGFITVDRRFLPSSDVFFMRIEGDSMVGRGLLNGDYVLVRPQRDVEEGEMAMVRIGEEATVKTVRHQEDGLLLQPANPAEREIRLTDEDDYAVVGKVCGVFRPFCETDAEARITGNGNGNAASAPRGD